ncbi:hypothetical protein HDV57DRAFT_333675 [Trichoderma longibrachiatum]|uniref:Uncharacterized protein n=1 Tax=Trichoderma longibrachiatum ATCC 18648 TaxID=983965 RepID=A0A2T4BYT5_TRILO|nr:hypothetical protein M440DRAFT_117473 [Trichoderma longibrachiatum ATCC 18648]
MGMEATAAWTSLTRVLNTRTVLESERCRGRDDDRFGREAASGMVSPDLGKEHLISASSKCRCHDLEGRHQRNTCITTQGADTACSYRAFDLIAGFLTPVGRYVSQSLHSTRGTYTKVCDRDDLCQQLKPVRPEAKVPTGSCQFPSSIPNLLRQVINRVGDPYSLVKLP